MVRFLLSIAHGAYRGVGGPKEKETEKDTDMETADGEKMSQTQFRKRSAGQAAFPLSDR